MSANIKFRKLINSYLALKTTQKKAARVACSVKWNKHCDPCFANLQALKFDDLYKLSCAKIALKSVSNLQVEGLKNCFIPTNTDITREGRSEANYGPKTRLQCKKDLITPFYTKEELRRLPPYRVPEIWNKQIPPNLKDFDTITFADAFKTQTIHEYSMFKCRKKNCYICNSWSVLYDVGLLSLLGS